MKREKKAPPSSVYDDIDEAMTKFYFGNTNIKNGKVMSRLISKLNNWLAKGYSIP